MSNARQRGITLIELLVVIAILSILATAVMPLSRMTVKRAKEIQLRSNLRILRTAIDEFKKDCTEKRLSSDYCLSDQDNYPATLELLTKPLTLAGTLAGKSKKYLRQIPRDPMMPLESPENPNNWGLRAYSDEPDSEMWGGGNVYDVYSMSTGIAIDGSKYSTW